MIGRRDEESTKDDRTKRRREYEDTWDHKIYWDESHFIDKYR